MGHPGPIAANFHYFFGQLQLASPTKLVMIRPDLAQDFLASRQARAHGTRPRRTDAGRVAVAAESQCCQSVSRPALGQERGDKHGMQVETGSAIA